MHALVHLYINQHTTFEVPSSPMPWCRYRFFAAYNATAQWLTMLFSGPDNRQKIVSPPVVFSSKHDKMLVLALGLGLFALFFTSPPAGVGSIAISVYVCLSVCLSVSMHIWKTTRTCFTKLSVHVACDRDSVHLWRQCDASCAFGLVVDAIFQIMQGIGQNQRRRICFVQFTRQWHRGEVYCLWQSYCILLPNATLKAVTAALCRYYIEAKIAARSDNSLHYNLLANDHFCRCHCFYFKQMHLPVPRWHSKRILIYLFISSWPVIFMCIQPCPVIDSLVTYPRSVNSRRQTTVNNSDGSWQRTSSFSLTRSVVQLWKVV